jgi:HD superfamily phosphohydrolase
MMNPEESESDLPDLETQMIVHDPIHGSFSLPKIAWMIIDTPEFQRLRLIKQTGNTCYVYPGSEHTRFQHCLGVAHLSMEFGQAIKLKSPDMITNHQILLLCLAGLCHDLGHCAFSHLYDAYIIPMFNESTKRQPSIISKHEEASYLILKRIWEQKPGINDVLSKEDLKTIGKMILGAPEKVPLSLRDELKWTEYDWVHSYLYEVVSNDRTGIDVDKFDYLKRDSHYTGIPCTFDPQRLMTFLALKHTKEGQYVLEYRRKSNELINAMWLSRDDLHRRAYQHRVVKCIDMMTLEMIKRCGDSVIPGTNTTLKTAHHDLDSYLLLTDAKIIALAEGVPEANAILDKIRKRDLWDTVAMVIHTKPLKLEFRETKADIRTIQATFRDEYVYYIYHTQPDGSQPIDTMFFVELINGSKGGEIHLRIKDRIRQIRDEAAPLHEIFLNSVI